MSLCHQPCHHLNKHYKPLVGRGEKTLRHEAWHSGQRMVSAWPGWCRPVRDLSPGWAVAVSPQSSGGSQHSAQSLVSVKWFRQRRAALEVSKVQRTQKMMSRGILSEPRGGIRSDLQLPNKLSETNKTRNYLQLNELSSLLPSYSNHKRQHCYIFYLWRSSSRLEVPNLPEVVIYFY